MAEVLAWIGAMVLLILCITGLVTILAKLDE